MGLLAGFIGGAGQGLADVAKTTYKDMLENDKIDKQNAFTSQQTEKQNQFTLERDKAQEVSKREALTFAITEANKYKEQYGQEAMRDVQQTGGKPVTEAGRQLQAQMEKDALAMDVGRSNINQSNAAAGASEAHANYYSLAGKYKQSEIDARDSENNLVKEYNDPNTTPERRSQIEQFYKMKKGAVGKSGDLTQSQMVAALQKQVDQETEIPTNKANYQAYNQIRERLGQPLWVEKRDPKTGENVFSLEAGKGGGAESYLNALGVGTQGATSPQQGGSVPPPPPPVREMTEADKSLDRLKSKDNASDDFERKRTETLRGQVGQVKGLISSALSAQPPTTIEELENRYQNNEYSDEEFKQLHDAITSAK